MFRNKLRTAAALWLCLSLASAQASVQSPNLISEDMIVSNTTNYNTCVTEYGVLEEEFSASGDIFLPYTYELYPKADGLKFEKFTVERGDVVRKGDVLAVFSANVDEVALEEKRLELERAQETSALELRSRQEAIDGMYMELLEIKDSYDAQMLKLKIRREELALEQYAWQAETEIENIRRSIDAFEEERAESVITAPADGIIERTLTKRAGDRIAQGEPMLIMYRTDSALVEVRNKMGNLRYGMEVEITVGNINKQTIHGRVVGADYMLPEGQRTDTVYVKPEYYDPVTTPIDNPRVTGKTVWLDNAMTLPRKAVSLESGRHYVTKYEDGMARKRTINASLIRQQVLVLQGLEAGEEIILD